MALTHHIIVKIAALDVGITHFTNYAILGDDVVIGNKSVALRYSTLINRLGVDISVPKTLVSDDSFEFAKRFIVDGTDFSPVGGKAIYLATKGVSGYMALFTDCIAKGITFSEQGVIEMLRKKAPSLSKKATKDLLGNILGPLGLVPTEDRLASGIRITNSWSPVTLKCFLISVVNVDYKFRKRL